MASPAPLAFIDIETTGTNPDLHEIWEVAVVRMEEGVETARYTDRVEHELDFADQMALHLTNYYERYHPLEAAPKQDVATELAGVTAGCHLVGMSVSFDAAFCARFLRDQSQAPAWHYHLVDVEAMIAGKYGLAPPWKSDDLTQRLGLNAEDYDRHTAMGDVEWCCALYNRLILKPGDPHAQG